MKIKLYLSAKSMPDDKPLKVIKDIINIYFKYDFPDNIPAKKICDVKFFCMEGNYIPEKIFSNEINLVRISEKYASLYPLTPQIVSDIESGICYIKNIKMKIYESGNREPTNAEAVFLEATLCYKVKFTGVNSETGFADYTFYRNESYDTQHIKYVEGLRTFCMYPDVPLEYEHRFRQYTFLYNLSSTLSGKSEPTGASNAPLPSGAETVNLANHDKLCYQVVNKPIHFIEALFCDAKSSGYILNLRTAEKNFEPLLFPEKNVSINLSAKSSEKTGNCMYAYIDFGSSSSAIGYRINNGELSMTNISGKMPVVRKLLADYDSESYKYYINLINEERDNIPSVNVNTGDKETSGAFPFHLGFVPYTRRFTNFEKRNLYIDVSHKSEMISEDIHKSTTSIIYNICYIAVCHAINSNCDRLVILPSFPNEGYADKYFRLWKLITEEINKICDINISNLLSANERYLLCESIAVTNGIDRIGENVLNISIDIGDSTTDMSAVFRTGNDIKVCGCSSINYAGKNLLKESFGVMIKSIGKKNDASIFGKRVTDFIMGSGKNHDNPFVIPVSEEYKTEIIKNEICRKFYPNNQRGGKPRNESWQNNFMELLEHVKINTADGKAELNKSYTGSADTKIKADLIMRYAVLMPVIKDFTETSLKMCESNENTVINIKFYGGGAKGILLVDSFTSGSFMKTISEYFRFSFNRACFTEVPDIDAKKQLLKGLSRLKVYIDKSGKYNVMVDDNNINFISDWHEIKPKNNNIKGKRALYCEELGLFTAYDSRQLAYNMNQRKNMSNYIGNIKYDFITYAQEITDIFITDEKLKAYFENSFIYKHHDSKNDFIKEKSCAEKIKASFMLASEAEIYPEMIRNATFMFHMNRLLSEHFECGFSGTAVTDFPEDYYKYTC
ncbi:MAG: hypothetical protein K2G36_00040 [Ruminococcus sp.]|nr:hypothetical protein [Ruminococcus sp.]